MYVYMQMYIYIYTIKCKNYISCLSLYYDPPGGNHPILLIDKPSDQSATELQLPTRANQEQP